MTFINLSRKKIYKFITFGLNFLLSFHWAITDSNGSYFLRKITHFAHQINCLTGHVIYSWVCFVACSEKAKGRQAGSAASGIREWKGEGSPSFSTRPRSSPARFFNRQRAWNRLYFLRSGDRLARTSKSLPWFSVPKPFSNSLICSFRTCSHMSNFDPLIQGYF